MKNLKEEIKKKIKRPLSEDDIKKAVKLMGGKVKIISYLDLDKYRDIDSLFSNYKYVVLLYTADESKVGHWVLLIRHKKDEVELFDSYAYKLDNLLKFFKKDGREMFPKLTEILYNSGVKKCHHITERLQRLRDDVGTCGKFVILRILFDLEGLSLADMVKAIKKNRHFKKGYWDGYVQFVLDPLTE